MGGIRNKSACTCVDVNEHEYPRQQEREDMMRIHQIKIRNALHNTISSGGCIAMAGKAGAASSSFLKPNYCFVLNFYF